MALLQKSQKTNLFIDYVPAELRENKTWFVEYYVKNPFKNDTLQRVKLRVRPINKISERRKLGIRMVKNINEKLEKGWNKFIEESGCKTYGKLTDCFDMYLTLVKNQFKKQQLSKDTVRAYTSFIKNITDFLIDNNKENMFVHEWTQELIESFLNEIFFERDNSATTHNNYLRFIRSLSKWMIKKKFLNVNPTETINTLRETDKKRIIIEKEDRCRIFDYLEKEDYNYYLLCYTAFYTLIRRTELTKIRVSDVFINNRIINIRAEVAKTNREKAITIPKSLIHLLANHLASANKNDYLFSANKFKPGKEQLNPKKISDEWAKMRRKLKVNKFYQWYSLKDTGITNYLTLGLPLIDVKNQARHYSITQTEAYTPKNIIKSISSIELADLDF